MSIALSVNSACAPLLDEERLMSLGPGMTNTAVREALAQLNPSSAFEPRKVSDHDMAQCCLAGLWLYHDFLDESHRISQGIATPSGSYWHAILHRREPDSWNSKYWFERVGRHPIYPELGKTARVLAKAEPAHSSTRFLIEQTEWDPFAFVDLCEACRLDRIPAEALCRVIQLREWQLLFEYCYQRAAV